MIVQIAVDAYRLRFLAAYNKARRQPTYVVHTPPKSTIGGVRVKFISFEAANTVQLRKDNGDLYTVPLSEVTVRVEF